MLILRLRSLAAVIEKLKSGIWQFILHITELGENSMESTPNENIFSFFSFFLNNNVR